MTSRAGEAGRLSKSHNRKAMGGGGKSLVIPPPPVFVPGLGAVYCPLAGGGLTAKPSAGLSGEWDAR